ncbi:phage major capsid protein [Rhizobacter sp. OV335]|uniref:phage major capsid protein n=1 Tax=Rhizobacter sp. OV335 TaxID=1500264 RepID=UPI000919C88C|nr:phage major capsid protein [Rhizobacter sp. OV335]SHN40058.1 hypothetical protein SAMN02787076_06161 [Rhizobacter sp. OV335]
MPFSAQDLIDAGKIGLDYFLANDPVDQIALERPLLKALQAKKKTAPGAKQFVVEQLRKTYQSNFQWYNGSSIVTYNRRQTIEQAQYAWRSCHDGFALDEDRLAQNGITITDSSGPSNATDAEKIQFTSLIEEQAAALKLGFQEQFSYQLHLDGTQSTDAIGGLDSLVSLAPTSGVVGGIDRASSSNAYWRNNFSTGLTTTTSTGTILNQMEVNFRQCSRNGGRPDLIIAGSQFIDGYRNFVLNTFGRMDFGPSNTKVVEGGTSVLRFQGVDVQWSPEFQELDARFAPATLWEKRCYFLNTNTIRLRPLAGHDMISRKPPRAYDRYEYYWAMTWKGALTMNRSNANSVLALV